MDLKRVLLIHTGGTLGMRGRRPHALKPGAFLSTLKGRVPELFELAQIELELFSNVDSSEIQPESWPVLAERLHQRLKHFDGAVVTHGTDTLAWSACALSFMLPGLDKPVVLTGAQRPLAEVRTDARLNLIDAVTSALQGPREVTVCFDSHLYRGNRVRKVSAGEFDAFDSPNCPPLGVLGVDVRFQAGLSRKTSRQLDPGLDPRVYLLKVFPGLDPNVVLPMLGHIGGLVVEAHGSGNFPMKGERSLLTVFRHARRLKVPVVVVSQAHRNGVDLTLYESGRAALDEGAISGGDMTSSAAVVKLMHGLGRYSRSGPSLAAYITRNVAGERTA
ncbi:MAG: asparaginase [Myxococcaceae bacterium]|nr:asparaginase [Myxococcaceae bacterium]